MGLTATLCDPVIYSMVLAPYPAIILCELMVLPKFFGKGLGSWVGSKGRGWDSS